MHVICFGWKKTELETSQIAKLIQNDFTSSLIPEKVIILHQSVTVLALIYQSIDFIFKYSEIDLNKFQLSGPKYAGHQVIRDLLIQHFQDQKKEKTVFSLYRPQSAGTKSLET